MKRSLISELFAPLLGFSAQSYVPPTPSRSRRGKVGRGHSDARKAGIPKAFRQYAKRYGGLDVTGILQIHKQAA